jgi:ABC-type antimicrobial peptide transport system permease subunit
MISGLLGGLLAGGFAYLLGLFIGKELLELPGFGSPLVILAGVTLQVFVSLVSALFAMQQMFRRSAGDAIRLTN